MTIQVIVQEKPNAPAKKNENGDEKKQAKKISFKERLYKVGYFDESKVDAIFDMLIANGQLTLPPCKRPEKIEKWMIPTTAGTTGRGTYTHTFKSWCKKASGQRHSHLERQKRKRLPTWCL